MRHLLNEKLKTGIHALILTSLLFFATALCAQAKIRGVCSDCHTMHNSLGGQSMNFDSSTTPNESLLRGTCLGCHAQGGNQALVNVGSDNIPQVFHSNGTDLAGGNFGYITGLKGSGESDAKGHNIAELTGKDDTLATPPGAFHIDTVNDGELTCAGTKGCHGSRADGGGISGAHHNNTDLTRIATPTGVGDSYRFLHGAVGLEDIDWQYTKSGADHNEYTAVTSPVSYECWTCHDGFGDYSYSIAPTNGTISYFCATCHGNYHTLTTNVHGIKSGIGENTSSPFLRHPTDVVLPSDKDKEYQYYTSYDVNVPVGRTVPPTAPNDTVTPGSDAVICLSCHMTHASNFDDMLRWDYAADCAAGASNSACGCFTCHTTKD